MACGGSNIRNMKVALILPYFGRFDSLFPLWLETCRWNKDFDWLVFTDDRREFDYPENVKVTYMEFAELREKIQKLYDFSIALDAPYRLCNFRPAYGEVFEEHLKDYDAWGFCDNDMLFGNLANMIPKDLPTLYKVGGFGHLSLVPNTREIRNIYKYADAYKIAFSHSNLLFYDEDAWPYILKANGYEIQKLHIADFKPRLWQHEVLEEPGREWMNKAHCFVWMEGTLWRYFEDKDGSVQREEYAYVHFLKRPMKVDEDIDVQKQMVIVPNRIFNMDSEEITVEFLREVSKPGIFWDYWKNSFRPKNFFERLKNRLYQNKRDRAMIYEMKRMVENGKNCLD